jgi:hypothetical protein
MANGEVSLTNDAKRVLCFLLLFIMGLEYQLGSKPSCLGFCLIVRGSKVKLRIFTDPLNTCFYQLLFQLDYWTNWDCSLLVLKPKKL